jgi:Leucine-rich repeat (LRR) protein
VPGVHCIDFGLGIASINLESCNLRGALPGGALSAITSLKYVVLDNNLLTGSIGPAFKKLSNLKVLTIGFNHITGTIPKELSSMSNLWRLTLENNYECRGSIPPELSGLLDLKDLLLSGMHLTGTIPASLSFLTDLERLELSDNYLVGSIPPELKQLHNLTSLSLGNNYMVGAVPDLPFGQYKRGYCSLQNANQEDSKQHNLFSCPLPREAALCAQGCPVCAYVAEFAVNATFSEAAVGFDMRGRIHLVELSVPRNHLGS